MPLVGAIVLLLVLAQLLLPGIAANRISSRLRRYGTVNSVRVKAWPAVELLWGHADSVTVRAGTLTLTPAQTVGLLWEARGLDHVDFTAAGVREDGLQLRDVSAGKRAGALTAHAQMTAADVKAALPAGFDVQLLSSGGGEIRLRASGGLFGVRGSLDAVARASEGRLVLRPLGFPLEALTLTLFSEPHVYIEGVGASTEAPAGGGLSYRLSVDARLR